MLFSLRRAAALTMALLLSACVSLAPERGYQETRALIGEQRAMPPQWPNDEQPATPAMIDLEGALRLAFFSSPKVRASYARIGIGRAEFEDARRLPNPSFGYLRLRPNDGEGSQITRSLAFELTDLLMLPARKRMADQAFVAVQQEVASEVLEELLAVELAWFEAVGAQHVATMRGLVAKAARQSAELAKRFHAAGNIEPLQLAQERANAASTEIEAVTARAEALKARTVLAILLGIDSAGSWQLEQSLAAPLTTQASESRYRLDVLVQQALARRLDLAAKQQALALKQQSLALVRRWRLLGHVEIGGERESEAEGSLRGPSIELALPLFNQGQGALARAEAETKIAEIELAAQIHVVKQDVHQHLEWMQAAAKIADAYRESLVPASQEIVQQSQAKVNFMLMGVFELLAAKREEYDAYEAYLSAVRDYWTARARLRHAVGGSLPDDELKPGATVDISSMLPRAGSGAHGHHRHHGAQQPEEDGEEQHQHHQHQHQHHDHE